MEEKEKFPWRGLLAVVVIVVTIWASNRQWGWLTGKVMYGTVTWSYIEKSTGESSIGVNPYVRPEALDSPDLDTQSEVLFCSLNLVSAVTNEIHKGDRVKIVYLYWGPITDSKLLRYQVLECKHPKGTKPPVK